MSFVTVAKIIEQTGKGRSAVERAMKAASVKTERRKGINLQNENQ